MVPVGPDVMFVGEDRSVRVIMECGGCGAVLARGVRVSQLQNLVVQCFHCKAFNEVLGAT